MFSFSKKNDNDAPVPEWANFFTAVEFNSFLSAVEEYFNKQNITYTLQYGEIKLHQDFDGNSKLGLVNLAQTCAHFEHGEWNYIVADYFDGVRKAGVFQAEFSSRAHDFTYAKEYIGVKLYHREYVESIEDKLMLGKYIAEDIFATLVFDFSDSIVNIRPEQTIQWGKYNEELFEIGIDNIKKKYEFTSTILGEEDIPVILFYSDHFYAPNVVFDLKNNETLLGSKGSLVGVPNRHSTLIYPIESNLVTEGITKLIPMINAGYNEGPGSISSNLFWYDGNNFINLPYQLENDTIDFSPPESFLDMLDSLE